jgi:formate-dependent nitrite reductase membrane component NrfD
MKAKTWKHMTQREKIIKVLKIDAIILTIFSLFVMGIILSNNYLLWGALITLVIFVNSILNNKFNRNRNRTMSDYEGTLTGFDGLSTASTLDPKYSMLYDDV